MTHFPEAGKKGPKRGIIMGAITTGELPEDLKAGIISAGLIVDQLDVNNAFNAVAKYVGFDAYFAREFSGNTSLLSEKELPRLREVLMSKPEVLLALVIAAKELCPAYDLGDHADNLEEASQQKKIAERFPDMNQKRIAMVLEKA